MPTPSPPLPNQRLLVDTVLVLGAWGRAPPAVSGHLAHGTVQVLTAAGPTTPRCFHAMSVSPLARILDGLRHWLWAPANGAWRAADARACLQARNKWVELAVACSRWEMDAHGPRPALRRWAAYVGAAPDSCVEVGAIALLHVAHAAGAALRENADVLGPAARGLATRVDPAVACTGLELASTLASSFTAKPQASSAPGTGVGEHAMWREGRQHAGQLRPGLVPDPVDVMEAVTAPPTPALAKALWHFAWEETRVRNASRVAASVAAFVHYCAQWSARALTAVAADAATRSGDGGIPPRLVEPVLAAAAAALRAIGGAGDRHDMHHDLVDALGPYAAEFGLVTAAAAASDARPRTASGNATDGGKLDPLTVPAKVAASAARHCTSVGETHAPAAWLVRVCATLARHGENSSVQRVLFAVVRELTLPLGPESVDLTDSISVLSVTQLWAAAMAMLASRDGLHAAPGVVLDAAHSVAADAAALTRAWEQRAAVGDAGAADSAPASVDASQDAVRESLVGVLAAPGGYASVAESHEGGTSCANTPSPSPGSSAAAQPASPAQLAKRPLRLALAVITALAPDILISSGGEDTSGAVISLLVGVNVLRNPKPLASAAAPEPEPESGRAEESFVLVEEVGGEDEDGCSENEAREWLIAALEGHSAGSATLTPIVAALQSTATGASTGQQSHRGASVRAAAALSPRLQRRSSREPRRDGARTDFPRQTASQLAACRRACRGDAAHPRAGPHAPLPLLSLRAGGVWDDGGGGGGGGGKGKRRATPCSGASRLAPGSPAPAFSCRGRGALRAPAEEGGVGRDHRARRRVAHSGARGGAGTEMGA